MNSENRRRIKEKREKSMTISENLKKFNSELPEQVTLVAVSKTKPVSDLMEAYNAGQRVFGENKIQEMESKWQEMPKDIQWHMIGHVQSNKVKYMAPFVSLVHAVDSFKLLNEINKEAEQNQRTIDCLLQIKIAEEDSKFGMHEADAAKLLSSEEFKKLQNVKIVGLMGMATFTEDEEQISAEFQKLKRIYNQFRIINSEFRIQKMYEGKFPKKRYNHTLRFLNEVISKDEKILDLGVPNPFSEILTQEGFKVINTKGEDLDLETSVVKTDQYDVVTAFEIFEHLVSPYNVLKDIQAKKLVASVPLKLWFASAYRSKIDKWDRHYHEFEDWQFDWLLEKAGWRIVKREKFTNPVKKIGIRPILRRITPRYYLVYAEKV